jgi:hypothetical protein
MVAWPAGGDPRCVDQSKETDMRDHLLLRLRTRWGRDALDEKLAFGADPTESRELALRAAQLRSKPWRDRIATQIERVLDDARHQPRGRAAEVVLLRRSEISAHAPELSALTARLRADVPIDARGVAMAARLVSDGTGPLYRDGVGSLPEAVGAARLALDPTVLAAWELAPAA